MRIGGFVGNKMAQGRSWLRAVTRRDGLEAGMEAELADHLERLTADLVRSGYAPAEAARRARIALGPALVAKEGMRASLGLRWWDDLGADLRFALRLLRKSPGFTAVAALSLALAIGANTTIFSVSKSLLYDRLNVPHPEQLRLLSWNGDGNEVVENMWGDFDPIPGGGLTSNIFSYPVYQQLRAHNQSTQGLFAFKETGMNATVRGIAQRVQVEMVSGNYYSQLSVRPQLGRPIQPEDDSVDGAGAVAVISEGLWERAYGRSRAVLGQTMVVNQAQMTIVGVNPRGFTGAKSVQMSPDIFVPLSMQPLISPMQEKVPALEDPNFWWVNIMARTLPGVKDAQAQAALNVQLSAAIRATMKLKAGQTIPKLALEQGGRGLHFVDQMFSKPTYVLMTMTGLVLLLACANIANLLLARGAQRQREMSVRLALGAGRRRVLRQLLTESLLLAAIGGAGGLLLGYAGRNALPSLLMNPWERPEINVPFDWGVFGFAAGITLITGVLFGLAPAWMAARSEVSSGLKESAQTVSRRRRGLGGKSIVAFQITLSTLLVVGAGLFVRTLMALSSVDVGFDAQNLVLFEISAPPARYAGDKSVTLHKRLEQAVAALPGVESVAPVEEAYLSGSMSNQEFVPEGQKVVGKASLSELRNHVGIRFFETMKIPIVAGRGFGVQDTETSPKVAVINQSLARERFQNVNPIGMRFRTNRGGKGDWYQIVGVCADNRYQDLRSDPPAQFFLPYVQLPDALRLTYAIRTRQSAAALAPSLQKVVQSLDRDLPMIDLRTQQEQVEASMQFERLFASLTAGFGVLALALACVGIYGVMAYSVANRTNEIGIRLALGAQPGQVRGMILRESTWLALAGIVVGVGAALALARVVKSMLYGIQPYDPVTFGAGVLILMAVALAAGWVPARRAAGVQPMEALRHE
jgi:predicted permease